MARPRTDIEPRLIASARECFARLGVDGSSLREIARGAKTSIGMVYYYFPTKDDLFHAVVEEVYSRLLGDLERALSVQAPFEHRILALYRRMGEASELELVTLRLIIQEMLTSPTRRGRLIQRFQRGHLALVREAIVEGVQRGRLRRDRSPAVLLVSTLAVGAVPQLVLRALGAQAPFGPHPRGEALAHELLSVLLEGNGSRAAVPVGKRKKRKR